MRDLAALELAVEEARADVLFAGRIHDRDGLHLSVDTLIAAVVALERARMPVQVGEEEPRG